MSQRVFAFQSERPGHQGNWASNWYRAEFDMSERNYTLPDGRVFTIPANGYTSTEQGMMQAKALCFAHGEHTDWNTSVARRIMAPVGDLDSPSWHRHQAEIKKMGGARGPIRGYVDDDWKAVRYEIVKDLNREKFEQNPELMDELLATGNDIIAEGASYDRVWGIGLSPSHRDVQTPDRWRGTNLLGKLLMELREEFTDHDDA